MRPFVRSPTQTCEGWLAPSRIIVKRSDGAPVKITSIDPLNLPREMRITEIDVSRDYCIGVAMGEMVERVRRAIVAEIENQGRLLDDDLSESVARSAIEAMREPTKEMVDLADDQFDWGPSGYYEAPQGSASAGVVWTAMIDAALADDKAA